MRSFPLWLGQKNFALLASIVVILVTVCAQTAQASTTLSFEAASQQAASEQRLLVLEFFSYNAAESKMLRDLVLEAASVKTLLVEKFVVVPVEIEKQPDLCKRYGVLRAGTLLVARPDGTELDRLGGRMNASQFLDVLQSSLAGRNTLEPLVARATSADAGVEAHFALGQAYARRRQGDLAFREYAWCLEQGPTLDPKGYRSYLPALLARLGVLGLEVPAAKAALETHREKAQQAAAVNATATNYLTLFKFNAALKQSARNADLFLTLPASSPLRAQLFGEVFPALVEQRRYREVVAAADLETLVGRSYPLNPDECSEPVPAGGKHEHDHRAMHRQRIQELTAPAVEALLGAGQLEKARRIAGRALEFDPSRLLRVRLIEGAQRSGSPDMPAFLEWVKTYQASTPSTAAIP